MLEWIKAAPFKDRLDTTGITEEEAGNHSLLLQRCYHLSQGCYHPEQQGMEGRAVALQEWGVPHTNENEQGCWDLAASRWNPRLCSMDVRNRPNSL